MVDDGSTDETKAVVESFGDGARYVVQPHLGAAAARNLGVRHSRGRFLTFLDADDRWVEDKTRRQLAFLLEHPDVHLLFGHAEEFHSPELSDRERARTALRPGRVPGYLVGTMMLRRETFLSVGDSRPHGASASSWSGCSVRLAQDFDRRSCRKSCSIGGCIGTT